MKRFIAILMVFSVLALGGCGNDDTETSSSGKKAAQVSPDKEKEGTQTSVDEIEKPVTVLSDVPRDRFATIRLGPDRAQPKIRPSSKPPPKQVIIRDLAIGTGPVAKIGDEVSIYYYSVDYETRQRKYFRWPPQETLTTTLEGSEPWKVAVAGMRAGGRREMIIPKGFFDVASNLDYFVEMVRVNGRDGGRRQGS